MCPNHNSILTQNADLGVKVSEIEDCPIFLTIVNIM